MIDAFAAAQDARELAEDIAPEQLGASVVAYFTGVQLVSNVRTGRNDLMESLETMWLVLVRAVATPENRPRLASLVRDTFAERQPFHAPSASDAVT